MTSDQKPSPFVEIGDHKEFYRFGQTSYTTGTSYAPEWDKNYFVISKISWVNDDTTGQPKQQKRGVFLTLPAARALLPVLKSAIEATEALECQRLNAKRQAQPKRVDDSDGHISSYLSQCGVRQCGAVGGSAGGSPNPVGSSIERTGAAERGGADELKFGGYSYPTTAVNYASTSASAAGPCVSPPNAQLGGKQAKPRAPRKQQTAAEKGGTAAGRPGRPRKIRKEDGAGGDEDDHDGNASAGEDGNASDTIMQ